LVAAVATTPTTTRVLGPLPQRLGGGAHGRPAARARGRHFRQRKRERELQLRVRGGEHVVRHCGKEGSPAAPERWFRGVA
jgi:hypothetical protein